MRKATILVIEDEEKYRRVIGLHLAGADYDVKAVGTAEEGWKLAGDADLILTDLKLPGMNGLELLEKLKDQNSHTPVIVMSAFGTVENAVEAMKRGAVDFLPKPFSLDHLSVVVDKAVEVRKLRDESLLGQVGPGAKKDELDFPLWRGSAPDEPAWPSPFGPGRPGWHIECSAMAMKYLGDQIDIHGGGRDLVFSHHESERAQSECLTGKVPFARAWMHTGLVRYEGRKMSKSLGNLVLVSQALERAPAAAVRLYLASHRYRRDWSFEWSGLAKMARLVERIRVLLEGEVRGAGAPRPGVVGAGAGPGVRRAAAGRGLPTRFAAALANDLDTPSAIRELRAALRAGDRDAVTSMLAVLAGTASLS